MALTKVSTGMLSADVASIDLNIDANTMYIDVSNNRVGINNAAPSTALDVTGSVTADGLTVETSTDPASITLRHTGNTSGFLIKNFSGGEAQLVNVDNGPMVFKTNDTERMRITSAGQTQVVGYDAMTLGFPAVAGGASRSGIKPTVTGAGAGQLQFLVGGDNTTEATTIAATLDASGNLGIGTSAPVTALDVRGEISVDYDATYGLRFYNEDRNNWSSIGNTIATGNTSANLVFKTSVGEAMRIDSSGHVIVKNGGRFYLESSSGFSPFLSESSNDLLFTVNNGERMRIDASGNVGINVASPADTFGGSGTLDAGGPLLSRGVLGQNQTNAGVLQYGSNVTTIRSYGATAGSGIIAFNTGGGGVADTERMRIDANGDLILGSTASLSGATITTVSSGNTHNAMRNSAATAGKFWRQEVDNANIFYIINNATTGVYMNDGGTTWVAISDETVKENIVEIEGALDKVMDYRCVEYNLIADENKAKKIGFIAQDWEVDYSPVVVTGADGKLGMQYTETIPVLLKAIQEQQATIEALTARIAALES